MKEINLNNIELTTIDMASVCMPSIGMSKKTEDMSYFRLNQSLLNGDDVLA